jgi:hypothetical protein
MLTRALGAPWLYPAREDLRARLGQLGLPASPPPSKPGEALLVSVSSTAATESVRTGLWRLRRSGDSDSAVRPFGKELAACLQTAERLAARTLPYLAGLHPLARGHWTADYLWSEGPGRDSQLDGASYGASSLIAVASLIMGVPAPADLAASASLLTNGMGGPVRLGPVGQLEHKIRVLAGSALGIRRLVVAEEQGADAKNLVERQAWDAEVLALSTVDGLFDVVWSDWEPVLQEQWRDVEQATRLARKLFFFVLEGNARQPRPVLSWRGVRHAAERVSEWLPPEAQGARAEAWFASRVAARHCGEPDVEIPWPDDSVQAALPRPVRVRYLAHVVQSALDGNSTHLPDIVEKALAIKTPIVECHEVDLEFLGALSRALSGLRRYQESVRLLGDVVDGWIGLNQAARSSYALSELIRVMGILEDKGGLQSARLAGRIASFEEAPETSDESRAYVRFALGRAFATVGDAARAIQELEAPVLDPARIPGNLYAARTRWLARALDLLGETQRADALRRELRVQWGDDSDVARLIALDRARRERLDLRPPLDRLRALSLQGMAPLFDDSLTDEAQAERILREYPY